MLCLELPEVQTRENKRKGKMCTPPLRKALCEPKRWPRCVLLWDQGMDGCCGSGPGLLGAWMEDGVGVPDATDKGAASLDRSVPARAVGWGM